MVAREGGSDGWSACACDCKDDNDGELFSIDDEDDEEAWS